MDRGEERREREERRGGRKGGREGGSTIFCLSPFCQDDFACCPIAVPERARIDCIHFVDLGKSRLLSDRCGDESAADADRKLRFGFGTSSLLVKSDQM